MERLEVLHVMPGLFCNFSCTHCVNDSGPKRTEKLSTQELNSIKNEISLREPRRLIFTGGEPTLHIQIINDLLSSHPQLNSTEVFLTTNGWFSKSEDAIRSTIANFKRITHLQLSYDLFHGNRISISDAKRLKKVCLEEGIEFNVSVCLSEPKDLIDAHKIQAELSCLVIFQKVDPVGRARINDVSYKYPEFEPATLERKCPNIGQVSYIVGKGFSVCCSIMAFNGNSENVFHKTIEEHFESGFYRQVTERTFKEISEEKGIDVKNLSADCSSICRLCEKLHERISS